MKSSTLLAIVIALPLFFLSAASAQNRPSTPEYDAVKDFSLASNPNGVWSYGSLANYSAPFVLYTNASTNCINSPSSVWGYPNCNTPLVQHNDTNQTECFESICVPPNVLRLDIGNQGNGPFISVVRWTAPQAGSYLFVGGVEGLDYVGPTSTDLRVIYNSSKTLLQVVVDSYEKPFIYRQTLNLAAGDTMDFAVDMGKDRDWHFDSTGLEVTVTQVQYAEPK